MSVTDGGATILPVHECWELLAGVTLGRLVTSVDGRPEIFPINYVVQRRTVLFRTAAGTKSGQHRHQQSRAVRGR